jgi:hypothetical protein
MQLIFGQQIHIGGMKASIELAEMAGIGAGLSGIDLCCCNAWARRTSALIQVSLKGWSSAGGAVQGFAVQGF